MVYNIIAYITKEYEVNMIKIDTKSLKNGFHWKEYLSSMTENKENLNKLIQIVKSKTDLQDSIKILEPKLENKNFIILTEDFCPDSLFNLPIFITISELISNYHYKYLKDQKMNI